MATEPAKMTAEDRQRILDELATQQAAQRQQQVTELADLHAQITTLRVQLIATEQSYRARHRHITTGGLLSATQLRALGLPALTAPGSTATTSSKPRAIRGTPAAPKPLHEIMSNLPEPPTKNDTEQTPST